MQPLIILDVCIGSAALIYDWPALSALHWWLIPYVAICPLYPFLLAYAWYQWPRPQPWLYGMTVLPAAMYGVLAIFYYPLIMRHAGITIYSLLSIVWVWIYAIQAWYMLYRNTYTTLLPTLFGGLWALTLLSFTLSTNSFDYLAIAFLTPGEKMFLLIVGILTIVMSNATLLLRRLATIHRRPVRESLF